MKKFLNSLRYGDRDTKIYLWTLLWLSAASLAFAVAAVVRLSFWCGAVSVICAVIAAWLFQSTSLKNQELQKPEKEALAEEEEQEPEAKEEKAMGQGEKPNDDEEAEDEEEELSRIEHYTEKQVVQIMRKHKVKRDNRKVMIDLCPAFHIRQSPAYFWAEKGKANFLVLEKEARVIQIPLNKIKEIVFEKGVSVQKEQDYADFQGGGFVARLFEEVLPSYYVAMKNGRKGQFKNLYSITPDLKVTNTSARALFDILKLDLSIHDAVMNSPLNSEYYKMAYKANVMWIDQVISTEEYREKIKEIFQALQERGMQGKEYDELVEQLVASNFITKEYAEYYKKLK